LRPAATAIASISVETRASHSPLGDVTRLVRGTRRPRTDFFLRAEAFFNLASEIEALDSEPGPGPPIIDSYGERSLHEQSHGQSFLALAANRFGGSSLYVLDEPEAALSVSGALALLAIMVRATAAGAQFVVATHSPVLLSCPGARIYELDEGGVSERGYDDLEAVRFTRAFLEAPDRFLRAALDELSKD